MEDSIFDFEKKEKLADIGQQTIEPIKPILTPKIQTHNRQTPENMIGSEGYGLIDKIKLVNLNQIYKDDKGGEKAQFKNFNFVVKDIANRGQFFALVGQSGCGKSTILRYIAGLQKPTSGEIYFDDKLQTDKDRIGMVFQQYSSLPWMTVLENVMLPLKIKGDCNKKDCKAKAMEMIQLLGLEGHEDKYAQYPTLSGGQLQRIAIARNLVANSEILLLDEPFSALDINTRLKMQDLLNTVFEKMPGDPTIIIVTHALDEAVYLADEIFIMKSNPGDIYKKLKIDLPLHRPKEIKRERKFTDYVNELEDIMMSIK